MNSSVLDRYSDFRTLVAKTFSANSAEMVDKALCFAAEALEGFGARRYDNNPMLDHGVAVARIVAEEIGLGRNSTIAAIVHDVVRIATQHHSEACSLEALSLMSEILHSARVMPSTSSP